MLNIAYPSVFVNPTVSAFLPQIPAAPQTHTYTEKVATKRVNFFMAHNELIDDAGQHIGAVAVAVYGVLARRVNNDTQICYLSIHSIAANLNLSLPTVRKALKKLVAAGMVVITKRFQGLEGDGPQIKNKYQLLPVSSWIFFDETNFTPPEKKRRSGVKNISDGGKNNLPNKDKKKTFSKKHNNAAPKAEIEEVENLDDVVVLSQNSVKEEAALPAADSEIVTALRKLRLTPDGAEIVARRHPERAKLCIEYWNANVDALSKLRNIGAGVRSSIEKPEKWRHIDAWAVNAHNVAERPEKPRPAPIASDVLQAAARRVLDAMPAHYREPVLRDNADIVKFVRTIHPNEFAAEMRRHKAENAVH